MKNARVKLVQIKKAAMDGILPTAVFCVIGSAVVTVKTVIRGIFEAEVLSSIDYARNTPFVTMKTTLESVFVFMMVMNSIWILHIKLHTGCRFHIRRKENDYG